MEGTKSDRVMERERKSNRESVRESEGGREKRGCEIAEATPGPCLSVSGL